MAIQIENNELKFIKHLILKYVPDAKIKAFGSRVKGTAKKYSDLDIAIQADQSISLLTLSNLEEAFANSDLVYKVDLIDWHRISPEFQQHIEKNCVVI